jgi:hypothetical protein
LPGPALPKPPQEPEQPQVEEPEPRSEPVFVEEFCEHTSCRDVCWEPGSEDPAPATPTCPPLNHLSVDADFALDGLDPSLTPYLGTALVIHDPPPETVSPDILPNPKVFLESDVEELLTDFAVEPLHSALLPEPALPKPPATPVPDEVCSSPEPPPEASDVNADAGLTPYMGTVLMSHGPLPGVVEIATSLPSPEAPPVQLNAPRSDVEQLVAEFRVGGVHSDSYLRRELKALAGLEATPSPHPGVSRTPPPVSTEVPEIPARLQPKVGWRIVPQVTIAVGGLVALLSIGSAWRSRTRVEHASNLRAVAAAVRSAQSLPVPRHPTSPGVGTTLPITPCRANVTVRRAPPGAPVLLRAAKSDSALVPRRSEGPTAVFSGLPCEPLEVAVVLPAQQGRRWQRIPLSGEELTPSRGQGEAFVTVDAR